MFWKSRRSAENQQVESAAGSCRPKAAGLAWSLAAMRLSNPHHTIAASIKRAYKKYIGASPNTARPSNKPKLCTPVCRGDKAYA